MTFEKLVEAINRVRPVLRVEVDRNLEAHTLDVRVFMFPEDRGAAYYAAFTDAIDYRRLAGVQVKLTTVETTEEEAASIMLTAEDDTP